LGRKHSAGLSRATNYNFTGPINALRFAGETAVVAVNVKFEFTLTRHPHENLKNSIPLTREVTRTRQFQFFGGKCHPGSEGKPESHLPFAISVAGAHERDCECRQESNWAVVGTAAWEIPGKLPVSCNSCGGGSRSC